MNKKILPPVIAFVLSGSAVVVCYFFIDRPVALYFYRHPFYPDELLDWLPRISDGISEFVLLGMVLIVAWRMWRPGGELQKLLLAIAVNLAVTFGAKMFLKGVFGRTWARDWIGHQRADPTDDIYGFHPFRFNSGYHSFPSGHAAVTFAVISILWIARPRWRAAYAAAGVLLCLALVALDYHYVGDVIAGGMLGTFTGICTARIFHIQPPIAGTTAPPEQRPAE